MAASQPRRGASVDQAQRLYTIRPLKWRRTWTSQYLAKTPGGRYAVAKSVVVADRAVVWVCYFEDELTRTNYRVFFGTSKRGACEAASADHLRRTKLFLAPARKAVR